MCIPVKGVKKSIICDLQKDIFFDIPNVLFDVLNVNKKNKYTVNMLKKYYNNEFSEGIDKYFNLLVECKFGFYTDIPNYFNDIDYTFNSPNNVLDAVIEISEESDFNLEAILWQLEELGCIAVEIRYQKNTPIKEIHNCLSKFNESRIKCFNLLIEFDPEIITDEFNALINDIKRINKIIIYSSNNRRLPDMEFSNRFLHIDENFCDPAINGEVTFIKNLLSYCEAQDSNLALNRKVCIDGAGNIKNYISHSQIFGNIKKDKIIEIISNGEFQIYWKLSNDLIEKCMDCQYRYSCFSCSEIYFHENKYFKKSQCNFDPYLNKWYKNT